MGKIVLYFSNSRFPLAIVAGAIHTGKLPVGKDPGTSIFQNLPFLNIKNAKEGEIYVMGKDYSGNDIYALSIKGERGLPYRLIKSFLRIYKIPRDSLLMVDSGVSDNWLLLAGCLINRIGFLAPLGRFFTKTGIEKLYGELALLSVGVRDSLGKSLD